MKKELQELKKVALLEQKNVADEWLKNATDEELQEAINQDLRKMGFNTYAEYNEAVKNFILEKDPHANVTHDWAIHTRFSELTEDFNIFEEFIQKYSRLEMAE